MGLRANVHFSEIQERLERLTGIVESLAATAVSHDDQIEALTKLAERHDAETQRLLQAYWGGFKQAEKTLNIRRIARMYDVYIVGADRDALQHCGQPSDEYEIDVAFDQQAKGAAQATLRRSIPGSPEYLPFGGVRLRNQRISVRSTPSGE
jgi:hypothetical protein